MGELKVVINETYRDLVNCTTFINGEHQRLMLPRTMFPPQLTLKCGDVVKLEMAPTTGGVPQLDCSHPYPPPPTPPPMRVVKDSGGGAAGALFLIVIMIIFILMEVSKN
jgi:hypothetical protein